MTYATGTLTGTEKHLDGTPATGTVKVYPSVPVVYDPAGKIVLAGHLETSITTGAFSIALPATDVLDPEGFTYTVVVDRDDQSPRVVRQVVVPSGVTVDLGEVAPRDPAAPRYAAQVGPRGPAGADGAAGPQGPAGAAGGQGPQGPAGVPDWTQLDTRAAGLVGTGSGLDTKLNAAYAAHPVSVSNLPSPLVIAHRGGANLFPENTMEAFRGAAALGLPVECDVSLLADGSLGIMHDTTMDRTTWTVGNTADQTAMSWGMSRADTDSYFVGGWGSLKVPMFPEYLGELGGKAVLVPEAKNGTGLTQILVDRIKAAGLAQSVILQVPNPTEAAKATAAGIASMVTSTTGVEYGTAATYKAAGVGYVGVQNTSVTDATIAAFKAQGIKVIAYLLNRQSDVAAWLARGGDGYFTDDPLYAQGAQTSYAYRKDSLPQLGTWAHGMVNNAGYRGKWSSSPWGFGWDDGTSAGTRSTLLGAICPVKNNPAADTYTLEFDWTWVSSVNTGRWVGAFIACPNDGQLDGNGTSRPGVSGYRVLHAQDGTTQIAKVTDNIVGAALVNVGWTAPTLGTPFTLRVTVSPTSIEFRNVTTGQAATTTDTSFRGGYVSLAASGVTAWCTRAAITA